MHQTFFFLETHKLSGLIKTDAKQKEIQLIGNANLKFQAVWQWNDSASCHRILTVPHHLVINFDVLILVHILPCLEGQAQHQREVSTEQPLGDLLLRLSAKGSFLPTTRITKIENDVNMMKYKVLF